MHEHAGATLDPGLVSKLAFIGVITDHPSAIGQFEHATSVVQREAGLDDESIESLLQVTLRAAAEEETA